MTGFALRAACKRKRQSLTDGAPAALLQPAHHLPVLHPLQTAVLLAQVLDSLGHWRRRRASTLHGNQSERIQELLVPAGRGGLEAR